MVFLIFIQILIENPILKQWRPDQMPHSAASDLGLHCLSMSHKKEAKLIRLEIIDLLQVLRFKFLKFRISGNFEFSTMHMNVFSSCFFLFKFSI